MGNKLNIGIIGMGAAAVVVLHSCKPAQQVASSSSSQDSSKQISRSYDSVSHVERLVKDTVFVKADSAFIEVPIFYASPCPQDSVAPIALQGAANAGRVQLRYNFDGRRLRIDCKADSLLLEIARRDVELYRQTHRADSLESRKVEVITNTVTKTVTRYRTPWYNWLAYLVLLAIIFRRPLKRGIVNLFYKLIPVPWR